MTSDRLEGNKAVVRLLVDRVINQWRMDELASVFEKEAAGKHETTSNRSGRRSPTGRWSSRRWWLKATPSWRASNAMELIGVSGAVMSPLGKR